MTQINDLRAALYLITQSNDRYINATLKRLSKAASARIEKRQAAVKAADPPSKAL